MGTGTNIIGKVGKTAHVKTAAMDADAPVTKLDAREIDGEPFDHIMAALENLPEEGTLLLINSFEPKPLYDVLARRGFSYETTQVQADRWEVAITHAKSGTC